MFGRKNGAEESVLQELCHFVIITVNAVVFAIWLTCILCEINSSYSLHCVLLILCRYVTVILKMCMKKFNEEKLIFDKFTAFLTNF